jgi:amino acid transporter
MNKRQRIAVWVGIAFLTLFAIFPYYDHRNAFNFILTNGISHINLGITGMVAAAIVLITAGVVAFLGKKEEP